MRVAMRVRGLTLLETLVTLVLVAMAAGLVAQALFQVSRIEQRLQGYMLPAQLETLHRVWILQALEGLMPGVAGGEGRFSGTPRELRGISARLPQAGPGIGPQQMRMTLVFDAATGETQLRLSSEQAGPAADVMLARWSGDSGRWLYRSAQGNWLDHWPPRSGASEGLPVLIAVERAGDEGWLLVARPLASAQALGQRIDITKLP